MSLFKRDRLTEMENHAATPPTHTVMIVDDEDGNLRVLNSMLSARFRVLQAADGRIALDMLKALGPDAGPCVILSDQRMPNMTGVELFEQIREQMPDTIRIIITGFVDVGAIVDAINRAGIYKFVVKPFDRNDLLLTVERAVEAYELRRKLDEYIHDLENKVRERTQELETKNQALQWAYVEIEKASLTDPLTGLGNRRFLSREMSLSKSSTGTTEQRASQGRRTAFLLVDLDHFKAVNDGYGHAAGDAVLARMGEILRQHCREGDLAVRWGGEEFLLRVAVDDEAQALNCANRLRLAVAEAEFIIGEGQALRRTCSIGIACQPFDPGAPDRVDWERTLALADAGLYIAKRSGRNAAICLSPAMALPADFERRLEQNFDALLESGVLRVLRDS